MSKSYAYGGTHYFASYIHHTKLLTLGQCWCVGASDRQ